MTNIRYAYLIFVISFTLARFLNPDILHPKITKKNHNKKIAPKSVKYAVFRVQSGKKLTGQMFFTQAPPVVPVTNMRYAGMGIWYFQRSSLWASATLSWPHSAVQWRQSRGRHVCIWQHALCMAQLAHCCSMFLGCVGWKYSTGCFVKVFLFSEGFLYQMFSKISFDQMFSEFFVSNIFRSFFCIKCFQKVFVSNIFRSFLYQMFSEGFGTKCFQKNIVSNVFISFFVPNVFRSCSYQIPGIRSNFDNSLDALAIL